MGLSVPCLSLLLGGLAALVHTSYGAQQNRVVRPIIEPELPYTRQFFCLSSVRWNIPVAPSACDGVLDATDFGPDCPGPSGQAAIFVSADPRTNENYLSLNVWAPSHLSPSFKKLLDLQRPV